jgi:hypothetical protein
MNIKDEHNIDWSHVITVVHSQANKTSGHAQTTLEHISIYLSTSSSHPLCRLPFHPIPNTPKPSSAG